MAFFQRNDQQLYYDQFGDGAPLVLLNGALDTIESDWSYHLPAFAERFRVTAYEHRGHGRSQNHSASFPSYAALADDLAGLLDHLAIDAAHFCGFSDGAITLLQFAQRYPQRVQSLILAGAQYTNDQQTLSLWAKMTPERISERNPSWAAELSRLHDPAHYPGYWKDLLQLMRPLWRVEPAWTLDELTQLTMPILLIAGERDGFGHPEQQLAMRRALPRSALCLAPNAGHFVMGDQPELFRLVSLDFLRQVTTATNE